MNSLTHTSCSLLLVVVLIGSAAERTRAPQIFILDMTVLNVPHVLSGQVRDISVTRDQTVVVGV